MSGFESGFPPAKGIHLFSHILSITFYHFHTVFYIICRRKTWKILTTAPLKRHLSRIKTLCGMLTWKRNKWKHVRKLKRLKHKKMHIVGVGCVFTGYTLDFLNARTEPYEENIYFSVSFSLFQLEYLPSMSRQTFTTKTAGASHSPRLSFSFKM